MTQWDRFELVNWYFKYCYTWQEVSVWGGVCLSGWTVALRYWIKYRRLAREMQRERSFPITRR